MRTPINNFKKRINFRRRLFGGIISLAILLFTGLGVAAQGSYPEPQDLYINDYANLLSDTDRTNVNDLLVTLRQENDIEATLLTIGAINDYNTGDSTIEAFATNLFNTWGIGDRNKNNGVLLLVAVNDRKVRIELGNGYENRYNDEMQDVINEHILPSFRNGNFSQGIYRGTRAIVGELTGEWPADLNSVTAGSSGSQPTPVQINSSPSPTFLSSGNTGFDFHPGFLWGGGGLAIGAAGVGLQRYRRYRKRRCPDCQTSMTRLDEVADDVYLDTGQKLEEMLKSIDYDAWKCPNCNYHTLYAYPSWFSGLKKCPQCSYRTVKTTTTVLEQATYTSTGRERITKDCQHCTYHQESIATIPMKTKSESSSSSSFGSSSSSSSSFGGGSSSGGGASGGW